MASNYETMEQVESDHEKNKAQQNYEQKVVSINQKLKKSWQLVKNELDKYFNLVTLDELKDFQRTMYILYGEYRLVSRGYQYYLENLHTEDSLRRLALHKDMDSTYDIHVNIVLKQINSKIDNLIEIRSTSSRSHSV